MHLCIYLDIYIYIYIDRIYIKNNMPLTDKKIYRRQGASCASANINKGMHNSNGMIFFLSISSVIAPDSSWKNADQLWQFTLKSGHTMG